MLLNIKHLGTNEHDHRLYHIQTPSGLSGILDMCGSDREITLLLVGTHYRRDYPASAGLDSAEPPRIRDLEGGYQVVQTFMANWEHATAEQRELLCEYDDRPINYWRFDTKKMQDVRTKNKVRLVEDRPVHVPAHQSGDWYKVLVENLRRALKGTTGAQNIRIGHVTVKRSILYGLLNTKSALTVDPVVELRYDDSETVGGSLLIRSADGRARVTVKHGAGDKHKGRYGFARRIAFVPA
ncbi:MAG: hypothetical protein ACYTGS_12160 [Planctomycetota bacterium]|jgi:hypothetical protein